LHSIYFKVALKNSLILPRIFNKNISIKIREFLGNFFTRF